MSSADLSIRHQNVAFASSPFFFFFLSSSMEFLRGMQSLSYEFSPFTRPDASLFKHKIAVENT